MQAVQRTCDGGCEDPTPGFITVEIRTKDDDEWHAATYCRECYCAAEHAVFCNAHGLSFNMVGDTVGIRLAGAERGYEV